MKDDEYAKLQQALKDNAIKDLEVDAKIRQCQDEGDVIEIERRALRKNSQELEMAHGVKYDAHRTQLDELCKESRDLRAEAGLIRHKLQYDTP